VGVIDQRTPFARRNGADMGLQVSPRAYCLHLVTRTPSPCGRSLAVHRPNPLRISRSLRDRLPLIVL
jgi:hypothetical protein